MRGWGGDWKALMSSSWGRSMIRDRSREKEWGCWQEGTAACIYISKDCKQGSTHRTRSRYSFKGNRVLFSLITPAQHLLFFSCTLFLPPPLRVQRSETGSQKISDVLHKSIGMNMCIIPMCSSFSLSLTQSLYQICRCLLLTKPIKLSSKNRSPC